MVVVDLRSQDRATGSIEGTINVPAQEVLAKLKEFAGSWQEKPIVGFFCQYSAHRAPTVANYYRNAAPPQQKVLVMDGGFRGWEAMQLPITKAEEAEEKWNAYALKEGADVAANNPSAQSTLQNDEEQR